MGLAGTINVRMDGALKDHGMQVFERNGISVSDAVRKLFEHVEREQAVPGWMLDGAEGEVTRKRTDLRRLVKGMRALPSRQSAGAAEAADTSDAREEYRRHLVEKHGFAGVRE